MNKKYIVGLLCLITLFLSSYGQNIVYKQYLRKGDNLGNSTVFTAGTKDISYKLQVDNGYVNLVVLPVGEYDSFVRGENYNKYDVASRFAFNNIDRETGWINIDQDFYIIINNNMTDEIYIYGYVNVLSLVQPIKDESIGVGGIIGIVVTAILGILLIVVTMLSLFCENQLGCAGPIIKKIYNINNSNGINYSESSLRSQLIFYIFSFSRVALDFMYPFMQMDKS